MDTPRRKVAQTHGILGIGHGALSPGVLWQVAAARLAPGRRCAFKMRLLRDSRQGTTDSKWGTNVMARKDDAPEKWAVIREWDAWASKNAGDAQKLNGMYFFTYLQKEKPNPLNFKYPGDKWQAVHGWLMRERRVKE
jgi:hypothetical protein